MPTHLTRCLVGLIGLAAAATFALAINAESAPIPKLAVFDFALEDTSAGRSQSGETPTQASLMDVVTKEAKAALKDSGQFVVIDPGSADSAAVTAHDCDGCDASIALRLGADQSLVGKVIKVEQAAYAVELQIRNARTGEILRARRGVFLGGDTGWRFGVASLIKHMVAGD